MMNKSQTVVGTVYSVSGNIVSISLADSVRSDSPIIDGIVYHIGQIGSFLKIPLGYTNIYGIVTQVGADAIPERVQELVKGDYNSFPNQQWMSMILIGEQVGLHFERGISQSPTTGDVVHLVTMNDLKIIYGAYNTSSSIDVGSISVADSISAYLDLDKIVSRHMAILGSTGSGKSNAVGTIVESIIAKGFSRTRILILDPHGEYNSVFGKQSAVLGISSSANHERLLIPYWALPFQEFVKLFDGNISEQSKEYFRTKVVEAKINGACVNNINIDKKMISADSPIPFSLKALWYELDCAERATFTEKNNPATPAIRKDGNAEELISREYVPAGNGGSSPFLNQQAKYMLPFLDSIRTKLQDRRFDFLFYPDEYTPDLTGKVEKDLSALLFYWLGGKKPITILDISNVPSSIMTSIAGSVLSIIYDALFWGQQIEIGGRKQPLLIVLEEAHNYLHSGENSIASRSIQRIAKEGRKYGVGLMMVTQRPSELDETVLSQCGTIISLRMNNSKDRGFVSSAMQDELRSMVDLLPSLRTGEAIVSGEGVRIPSRIQFYKLVSAPKSTDPKVSEAWNTTYKSNEKDYSRLLELWRNKKFEMEEIENE